MESTLIIGLDDTKRWYLNDKLHRLDGPAVIWHDGTQIWYQNGKRHRLDGPAIIMNDGTQVWCQDNKYHRLDGPAKIFINKTVEYWAYGVQYDSFEELTVGVIFNQ